MTRIPNLTNDAIISAFFGDAAEPYSYTVTQDEFDEYDNEGPGDYDGVEVPLALAKKWDAGLAECKRLGIHTRSREGLTIRYRIMTGSDTLPAGLVAYIDEREAAVKAKTAEQERKAAASAEQDAKLSALFPLGIRALTSTEYEQAWGAVNRWPDAAPAELVATNTTGDRLPKMPGNEHGYTGWTEVYRVAERLVVHFRKDGVSIQGIEVKPEDATLLADFARRNEIVGYRFDPELYEYLVALDGEHALCERPYSYFGGTPRPTHGPATKGAYAGEHNETAAEKRAYLRTRLAAIGSPQALEALKIVEREDSITEIR